MKKLFNTTHKKVIAIILVIATTIVSFIFTDKVLLRPSSSDDFEYLESVAQSVFNQGEKVIYEIPNNLKVSIENHQKINVNFKSSALRRGIVYATLQNGNLKFERDTENDFLIFLSISLSIILNLIFLIFYIIFDEIKKKKSFKIN